MWTFQEQLPPAKFVFDDDGRRGMAVDSMVSGGCIVSGATVRRSVLFSNVRVDDGALVEDCVVLPDVAVGPGVQLRRAVVDRHCRLERASLDDPRRFRVTEKGLTLITPEMLGQHGAPVALRRPRGSARHAQRHELPDAFALHEERHGRALARGLQQRRRTPRRSTPTCR